jgi:hypothetical protein
VSSPGSRGGGYISDVDRATSDTSTLWVATRHGRLFVSKNADGPAGSVRFDRIDTDNQPGRFISGIAVDPNDANHAFVSYSGYNKATPIRPGHVFSVRYDPAHHAALSKDMSFDLPDTPITDVVYDDATGDLFASTDYGVLRLPAGSQHWRQAAPGLPLASVPGLTLSASSRVLYAPTYGRAVWKLELGPAVFHVAPG